MLIVLASDHAGFALKRVLVEYLREQGHQPVDLGPGSEQAVDYPDKAQELSQALLAGRAQAGILICGSGIGMCMAANRAPGIRAALAPTEEHARLARAHNNANVLCLGSRLTPQELALRITDVFLNTSFEGGRHLQRVAKLG